MPRRALSSSSSSSRTSRTATTPRRPSASSGDEWGATTKPKHPPPRTVRRRNVHLFPDEIAARRRREKAARERHIKRIRRTAMGPAEIAAGLAAAAAATPARRPRGRPRKNPPAPAVGSHSRGAAASAAAAAAAAASPYGDASSWPDPSSSFHSITSNDDDDTYEQVSSHLGSKRSSHGTYDGSSEPSVPAPHTPIFAGAVPLATSSRRASGNSVNLSTAVSDTTPPLHITGGDVVDDDLEQGVRQEYVNALREHDYARRSSAGSERHVSFRDDGPGADGNDNSMQRAVEEAVGMRDPALRTAFQLYGDDDDTPAPVRGRQPRRRSMSHQSRVGRAGRARTRSAPHVAYEPAPVAPPIATANFDDTGASFHAPKARANLRTRVRKQTDWTQFKRDVRKGEYARAGTRTLAKTVKRFELDRGLPRKEAKARAKLKTLERKREEKEARMQAKLAQREERMREKEALRLERDTARPWRLERDPTTGRRHRVPRLMKPYEFFELVCAHKRRGSFPAPSLIYAPDSIIRKICQVCHTALTSREVHFTARQKTQLRRYKSLIKTLAERRLPEARQIIQRGGAFPIMSLLPVIIKAVGAIGAAGVGSAVLGAMANRRAT
jgi:hypothetical protein